MNVIETDNLTKYYDRLCAVDAISLSVGHEIFGLLGPNGSGKTTTMRMLTTLLRPDAGDAWISGHHVVNEAREVRNRLSYVPQEMAVDINLTGRENVALFAHLYGVENVKDRVDEMLGLMLLSQRADDLVKTYSGGMRRRLELAQALVHEPEVLFLDEPTIGLDVAARKNIWEHITALRDKGMTIFVNTHYMDEADRACDRVGIIDRGRLIAVDTPGNLKDRIQDDVITVRVSGKFDGRIDADVRYMGQVDDELMFTAGKGSEAVPRLAEALTGKGMKVHAISVREATLDDVFLRLVTSKTDEEGRFDGHGFRLMLRRR